MIDKPMEFTCAHCTTRTDEQFIAASLDETYICRMCAEAGERRAGEMLAALHEISKGRGAFNRDPLEHAANTIENMKKIARAAIISVPI